MLLQGSCHSQSLYRNMAKPVEGGHTFQITRALADKLGKYVFSPLFAFIDLFLSSEEYFILRTMKINFLQVNSNSFILRTAPSD